MVVEKKGEGEDLDFYKKEKISEIFDQPGTGFVLIPAGWKKPPDRNEWQKKQNQYSFQEAQAQEGIRNVGVVAGNDYIILDVDKPPSLNGLEFPKSTKWETRPQAKRYAMWFKCEDRIGTMAKRKRHAGKARLALFDSHQLVEVEDKKGKKTLQYAPVGEIKLEKSYEVIPPSWKRLEENGNRVEYRFLDGGEIAPQPISLEWLLSSLGEIGIVLSSKPAGTSKSKGSKIDIGTEKNETQIDNLNKTNDCVESEVSKLTNTQEGDRNNQLNVSAFNLALAGVDYKIVYDTLMRVARSIGLDSQEIESTIRSGFSSGIERRIELEEVEPSRFIKEGKVIPKLVADDILGEFTIRTRSGDHQIFFYDNGIYNPKGKDLIRKEVEKMLEEASTAFIKNEVLGHIRDTTLTDPSEFNCQKNLIHLGNGIFDLDQMGLREFNKEVISTTKLPITYVENADCPKFREFLGQILTPSDASLIQEVFGWCLIKDYRFQDAVMCVGSGANGKSTLLEVLKTFLGKDNIANIPLQHLGGRFTTARLFGKLANIYPDLPTGGIKETGVFKMLTGGDQIEAERKYSQEPVTFVNYAKMIFSANKIPETSDESDAFFRRWLLVNFPNKFEGDEADTFLGMKITTVEELSGIFNWTIVGCRRLIKRGGFEHRETEKVSEQYRRMSSSLLAFVEDCVEEVAGDEEWVSKEEFYNAYIGYCKAEGLPTIAKNVVGRELAEHVHVQGSTKRTEEGKVRVWKGIRLTLPTGGGNRLVTDW